MHCKLHIDGSGKCEKDICLLDRTRKEEMYNPGYGVRRVSRKETTGHRRGYRTPDGERVWSIK